MEIQIKRREVYGNQLIYVCNEPAITALKQLTGKKTLSEGDLKSLQALGHIIFDCDKEIKRIINS